MQDLEKQGSTGSDGDWSQWRRLVLAALEDTKNELEANRAKLQELETKITVLDTKLIVWGAMAGVVSAAIVTFVINRIVI
jgi:uncharacterized membrane protein